MAYYDALAAIVALNSDQNPTGLNSRSSFSGTGPSRNFAMCEGPDGQPWVSICVFDTDANGTVFQVGWARGPYVLRWEDPNWVLVTGPCTDGGIGVQLAAGALGIGAASLLPSPAGSYNLPFVGAGNGGMCIDITCDGTDVFATFGYGPATGVNPVPAGLGYWRVRTYSGGAWSELGAGVHTHEATTGGSSTVAPGAGNPKASQIKAGAGQLCLSYIDITSYNTGTGHGNADWYVSQYSGGAWADLGGSFFTVTGQAPDIASGRIAQSMELDEAGVPSFGWVNRSNSPNHPEINLFHWNGSSWDDYTQNIYDIFTTLSAGDSYRMRDISLSPITRDPSGNWRHVISLASRVTTGSSDQSYIFEIEYWPATGVMLPLLGDEAIAIGATATLWDWVVSIPPRDMDDRSFWYWVVSSVGTTGLYHYNNTACNPGWSSISGGGYPVLGPPDFYIDALYKRLYREGYYEGASHFGDYLADYQPIEQVVCGGPIALFASPAGFTTGGAAGTFSSEQVGIQSTHTRSAPLGGG